MLVFPNCKINLGLNIISKRADGFHDLETVFYPIPFQDALEVIIDPAPFAPHDIRFSASGLPINGNTADNLCVKAWQLLLHDYPNLPSIQMHLHKAIPMGAGLGGGSSNGAFALQLINNLLNLQVSEEQLQAYALQLGSDCPFFQLNKPCYATGRGELLQPVHLNLEGLFLVLVNPGIHVSTREAFASIQPAHPQVNAMQAINAPIHEWKHQLSNDFETGVFGLYPAIRQIKTTLYEAGALYASMTGTGSTVYGIFQQKTALENLFAEHYMVKEFRL